MNQAKSHHPACPECQEPLSATAPHGLCSRCLVVNALSLESAETPDDFSLPLPEELNSVLPDFEIQGLVGRGGMGAVYEARQKSLDRAVALKLLPTELLRSADFFERFQREAKIMARMDHPNIARVFDSGITRNGEAYMVIELLRGVPITDYAVDKRLGLRKRLELFIKVCSGVQHAHHKGIIHRDLKPSNILVVEVEDRPVPKVIDFGLAKPIEQISKDDAVWRSARHALGTPAYMSPEQAAGEEIDSRSDIYSLGALLYQLLTERTLFDDPSFRNAAQAMAVRTIQSAPIRKPSDSSTAQQPIISPHELEGDLDAIVLKALEKDPARRYQTVVALADDIERYFTHQAVIAMAPAALYRVRKFCRRHWISLAISAAFLMVLLISIGLLARKSVLTRRAEQQALHQLQRGERLIEFILGDLHGRLYSVGRLDVLESAVAQVERFYTEAVVTNVPVESLRNRAHARLQLGRIRLEQGKPEIAKNHYEEAINLYQTARARQPELVALLEELGQAWNTLAVFHHSRIETNAAERAYREALGLADILLKADPSNVVGADFKASTLQNFGALCDAQGRTAEAEEHYTEALRLLEPIQARAPDNTQLLEHVSQVYQNLAFVQARGGHRERVERSNAKALELRERLVKLEPNNVRAIELLANIQQNIAEVHFDRGNFSAAEEWMNRYRPHRERLANLDPQNSQWQHVLADAWRNYARLQEQRGKLETAADAHRRGWEIAERKLPDSNSQSFERSRWLTGLRAAEETFVRLARTDQEKGKLQQAREHWQTVFELRAKLANEIVNEAPPRDNLALASLSLAVVDLAAGDIRHSTEHAHLALLLLTSRVDSDPLPQIEESHWNVLRRSIGLPLEPRPPQEAAKRLLWNSATNISDREFEAALANERSRLPAALEADLRKQFNRAPQKPALLR
jgi:eukaryotic-like serine/threonine-protein kinase